MENNNNNNDTSKALRLFGEVFLKTLIILLGVAILVFAIYFLVQIFGGGSSKSKTTEDTGVSTSELSTDVSTEASTEAPTEATTEAISSVGHSIEVLNSTETAGVAAGWQQKLTDAGYTVSQIGNYETEALTSTKIIVTQEGMGEDLKAMFKNATVEVGSIDSGVEIRIIVGTEDVQ